MGKRKIFAKTDLSVPQVEHSINAEGNVVILPEAVPPSDTVINFPRNATSVRSFEFARWYGVGIDLITYSCQRQSERFLTGLDSVVNAATVVSYCTSGLRSFLDFCTLQAMALGRELALIDVNRSLIDGYLRHLGDQGSTKYSQKQYYSKVKPVLLALGRRGLFPLVASGDAATFPRNPFPNSNRSAKGETALSKRERQEVAAALRQAIKPIWIDGTVITRDLLVNALLVVALHTGRNPTPLLEMGRNCLRPHPKDGTVFLVLWKRRGYNHSKVALRAESKTEREVESMPSVRVNVERLIRRVMTLTEPLDSEAPDDLKGRVWLYRSRARNSIGHVTALTLQTLNTAVDRLVAEYSLKDSDETPPPD